DPDETNNTATDMTAITPMADVTITKTGPAGATAGLTAVFTVGGKNLGPSAAANVVVTDPTPPGLTFMSNTGACTTAYPCTLVTLGPTQSATITTTYAVPPSYSGPNPIVNTVSVTSATTDPVAGNNTATATVPLNAPVAALTVTKT